MDIDFESEYEAVQATVPSTILEETEVTVSVNTLLFLLDKVEDCYKSECEKVVKSLIEK